MAGEPYVKSRHSAALMQQLGRSHRSVEFKHQNISAVLDELGMPWIQGYKPKRNYQNAIFAGIDRYLTAHSIASMSEKSLTVQGKSVPSAYPEPRRKKGVAERS